MRFTLVIATISSLVAAFYNVPAYSETLSPIVIAQAVAPRAPAPPRLARVPTGFSRYTDEKRNANENTVTIMGSQAASTYTRMTEDIQSVLDKPETGGLRVLPMLGRGGGQNFLDMLFLKGIDMGFVEQDVVQYFKRKDPVLHAGAEQRIQYIAKVANSEVHVFARPEIEKLSDLAGKTVSYYKANSSSAIAAETIFGACGVAVNAVYLDQDLAFEKLKAGEIAAVVRISGAPHNAFEKYRPENGHYLPLDEANLPSGCYAKLMDNYLPAALKNEHYPALIAAGTEVPTLANATLLAVYAWPENSERYNRVAKFVGALFEELDELRKPPRHPKWQDVNLYADVPGWVRFKPAQQWLDTNRGAQAKATDMQAAFAKFVDDFSRESGGAALTAEQRDAMFAKFTKWWTTQQAAAR